MRYQFFFVVCSAFLAACEQPNNTAPGSHQSVEANPVRITLVRGRLSELALTDLEAGGSNFEILKQPSNGILRNSDQDGFFNYQHGGASKEPDLVQYRFQNADQGMLSRTLILEFREASAGVQILAPTPKSRVRAGSIEVRYALSGADYDHLHISLNHRKHNTIRDLTGSYFLEDVPTGTHHIHAQLVDSKHRPIDLPTAKAEISVEVIE